MYSQQPSNVPTRLQSNTLTQRKPRFKSRLKEFICTKAVSFAMATILVVLSLSTGIFAANAIDNGLEVGFEPEYQNGEDAYASDNAMFEQYDNAVRVDITFHGNQKITVYSADSTVGELLNKLSVTLGANDVVSVDASAQVTDGMLIEINRVETNVYTENVAIPHESKTVENSSLTKGTTKLTQQGADGELLRTITETYVNGALVTSEVTSEVTTVQPTDEITEVGTKLIAQVAQPAPAASTTTTATQTGTVSTTTSGTGGVYTDCYGNSYQYLYYIDVVATAYGYEAGSVTATGKHVDFGMVAVDPKVISYETRCYITGSYGDMGVHVAEDCGGFKGNRIDIFLGDEATCLAFGRRTMRVYILA